MKLNEWLGLVSLVMAGFILWYIRHLLLLLFLAIVLAIAMNRVVNYLQRWRFQRQGATILTLNLVAVLALLFVRLVIPPFWEQFKALLQLAPEIGSRIQLFLAELETQEQFLPLNQLWESSSSVESLSALGANLVGNVLAFFSNSLTAFLQTLFVIVLASMILFNPQAYRQGGLKLFPSFYRRRADEILTLSELALGNWLTGIVINSLFIAGLSGVGLWLLQIKLVLVHALMAGILNFIPNIGPAASVVFPLMIALLDSPWKIGAVLVLYFLIQNIEGFWLTPIVMAKQVSLLPAVTLLAQLFFTSLFGLLGLLLALPLTVVAKTWLEEAIFKDVLDQWA